MRVCVCVGLCGCMYSEEESVDFVTRRGYAYEKLKLGTAPSYIKKTNVKPLLDNMSILTLLCYFILSFFIVSVVYHLNVLSCIYFNLFINLTATINPRYAFLIFPLSFILSFHNGNSVTSKRVCLKGRIILFPPRYIYIII